MHLTLKSTKVAPIDAAYIFSLADFPEQPGTYDSLVILLHALWFLEIAVACERFQMKISNTPAEQDESFVSFSSFRRVAFIEDLKPYHREIH